MNPLLLTTRTGILERQLFERDSFADGLVLAAVEAYCAEGSTQRRSQDFMEELLPIWKKYEKQDILPVFETFVELEFALESSVVGHASHVNHVIQEFLLGYNILHNCRWFLDKYHYDRDRQYPNSDFGGLLFAWMCASLLHDVGYDIEEAYEEEKLREKKNDFWHFVTQRAITSGPMLLQQEAREALENHLLPFVTGIPGAPALTTVQFEKLYQRKVAGTKWFRYDHGVISALKYIHELARLEASSGLNYLGWPPNAWAAIAMALHNFRYKDVDITLEFTQQDTLPAYLLVVCDEAQEWERERTDQDSSSARRAKPDGMVKRETSLMGVSFTPEYAYAIIDHRLKDASLRTQFRTSLYEKVARQKRHLPIEVHYPMLLKRLRKQMLAKTAAYIASDTIVTAVSSLVPLAGGNSMAALLGVTLPTIRNALRQLISDSGELASLEEIAKTETEKHLLRQTPGKGVYKLMLEHRVDGEPCLVTAFPF